MVQMAINAGMPPLEALAAATVRPARHLGLRDLGAIAPGYHADFMVMDDLTTYPPGEVFVQGHLAATNGNIIASDCPELPPLPEYPAVPGSLTIEDFRLVVSEDPPEEVIFNAAALQNDRNSLTILEKVQIVIDSGYAVFSEGDDLVLTAIFARNGSSHMVGVLKGTGLTGGAFASSLSHDSHNLLVVGRDVQSMHRAAQAVYDMGGGVAVGHREEVVASLPLPYFGLLSDEAVPQVARDLSAIEDRLRASGMRHQRPFLLLSVIGLSVSPYVKFTDKGIVDTERRCLLPAWEKASIS